MNQRSGPNRNLPIANMKRRGAKTNLPKTITKKSHRKSASPVIPAPSPAKNSHKEKADDYAEAKEADGEQQSTRKRETNSMSIFIVVALSLIAAAPIGIAIANWQKGSYGNLKAALFWGIGAYLLVGAVLVFAYYSYVIKPAKTDGPRAFLDVTSARVFRGQMLERVEPDPPHYRARIIAENAELLIGDVPVVEVVLTNTGGDMARRVKGVVVVTLGDMIGENPNYYGTPIYPLQSVVDLPKGRTLIYHSPNPAVLTAEDLKAIREFRKYLLMYGVITYLDPHEERKTKFCFLYDPLLFRLGQCPAHNSFE